MILIPDPLFCQFGNVVEIIRPVDKLKDDAPKNFCFVTFDKEEPAKQLVIKGSTSIKGHQVVISRVSCFIEAARHYLIR